MNTCRCRCVIRGTNIGRGRRSSVVELDKAETWYVTPGAVPGDKKIPTCNH